MNYVLMWIYTIIYTINIIYSFIGHCVGLFCAGHMLAPQAIIFIEGDWIFILKDLLNANGLSYSLTMTSKKIFCLMMLSGVIDVGGYLVCSANIILLDKSLWDVPTIVKEMKHRGYKCPWTPV